MYSTPFSVMKLYENDPSVERSYGLGKLESFFLKFFQALAFTQSPGNILFVRQHPFEWIIRGAFSTNAIGANSHATTNIRRIEGFVAFRVVMQLLGRSGDEAAPDELKAAKVITNERRGI